MCNLYRLKSSREEVADFFEVIADGAVGNAPEEVYPGYPGLVVANGTVQQMTWGFPLARTGAKGQPLKPKPINNARSDKLQGGFWRPSFLARRCLVPVNAFAEAEGARGSMTRTWFSQPDQEIMAVAGLWRPTAEWGAAFTMVMTSACVHVQGVHDRMPVILPRKSWRDWLGDEPDVALALCRPWEGDMRVDRTSQPWAGAR